ncbi:hypothetical protein HY628_02975 [Candidatus Uhrbacteria bacterium]|nr:hypothetical protein [Candidatus Uhrbacteria bacterium]
MDFGANVWIARGLSLLVPLALFLLGARDFIPVIGLAGGVTGGLTGVLLMALYGKLLEKQRARPSRWIIPVAIGIFFLVGAVAEVLTFMRF